MGRRGGSVRICWCILYVDIASWDCSLRGLRWPQVGPCSGKCSKKAVNFNFWWSSGLLTAARGMWRWKLGPSIVSACYMLIAEVDITKWAGLTGQWVHEVLMCVVADVRFAVLLRCLPTRKQVGCGRYQQTICKARAFGAERANANFTGRWPAINTGIAHWENGTLWTNEIKSFSIKGGHVFWSPGGGVRKGAHDYI